MIERLEISFNKQKQFISDVSHLLYITKADTGKVNLKKTKINIQELINEIIEETKLIETDKNGEIDIYSTKDNGKIYINIKDNGIGISKEEQENIFDRFYRVDKSRNKETGGVGLGLAIAKSIANVNGAEIKLESELAKGSKFIIIFKEYI